MPNLQDLLDKLSRLEVDPREVPLTGRELGMLTRRAQDVVESESDSDDELDDD
jgi:hypothetical protein